MTTWAVGWNCTVVSLSSEGRALLAWRHFFIWETTGQSQTLNSAAPTQWGRGTDL